MDVQPLLDLNMGNQNMLEWVYTDETLMDTPLVSNLNFPVTVPDVFNPFINDPNGIFASSMTIHDPHMSLIPYDCNIQLQQPPVQEVVLFDDYNLDFLKLDNYIPTHHKPILLTPNENQFTMVEASDLFLHNKPPELLDREVQNEGIGLFGYASSCGENDSNFCYRSGARSGRSTKSSSIGFEEISKYFYMTITDAAKEMKIGLTVLKKRCRELGISRWPHRKMKSLRSLIHNVQELGKGASDTNIQREIESLEKDKKLMEKMPELELSERSKKLRQACFKANYKKRRAMQPPHHLDTHKAIRQ